MGMRRAFGVSHADDILRDNYGYGATQRIARSTNMLCGKFKLPANAFCTTCRILRSCVWVANALHNSYGYFFLVAALRTTSIPNHLELSLSKNVLVFLALFSYVTFVLFADTALHSFTSSPSNMLPQCSEISVLITDSVRVLSVFILVISFFLFYLFLITIPDLNEKNIIYYNSVNTKNAKNNGSDILDDEFGEDESEDLVFQTRL